MAAVALSSLILGERPTESEPSDDPAGDYLAVWPRSAEAPILPPGASLDALAEYVEESAQPAVTLDADELPPALCTYTALTVLRRRAERTGKTLALRSGSPDVQRIAVVAGLLDGTRGAAARAVPVGWLDPMSDLRAPDAPTVPIPTALGATRRNRLDALPAPATPGEAPPLRQSPLRSERERSDAAEKPARAGPSAAAEHVAAVRRAPRGRARVRWFGSAAVGALTLIVALVAPSARVTLTPLVEGWTAEMPITVDPTVKKPELAGGKLPGRIIKAEASETKQVPTTGRRPAPDARATGTVVFINRSEKPVTLPKGTVVAAGPVKFTTQSDVVVRASVRAGSLQNIGMSEAQVIALAGGVAGNVDRFQINRIEGTLASAVEVNNNQPTKGGSEKTTAFVTAEDRRQLQDQLYRLLSDRLSQQLKSQMPSPAKETAIPWAGQNPAIVEANFSKNEGDEAQTLSLTLKVRYGATIFSNDAYNSFTQQLATSSVGRTRQDMQIISGSLAAEPPSILSVQPNGAVKLMARARGSLSPAVDTGRIRAQLANQPMVRAEQYLDGLQGLASHGLESWPGWLHRTPWLSWRIGISVQWPA
jgi:hypothetical protein